MKPSPRLLLLPLLVAATASFLALSQGTQAGGGVRPVPGTPPPAKGTGVAPVEASAPLRLSDPDGQEMVLEELSVKAAVHGMLSLTELELVFRNPQPRRMEGRFTCVLPAGAAISRFAKEVNGHLMEGEVVERLKAHRVYDTILQEMRDPALLEVEQGNRFSARVFPIEAGAPVRLVLSYSRLLPLEDGVRTFTVPLRGLPTIGRFRFRGLFAPLPGEVAAGSGAGLSGPAGARAGTARTLEMDEARYTPERDLVVSWSREAGAAPTEVLTAGDFALTAFHPDLPAAGKRAAGSWLFLVDTSASTAEALARRGEALAAVLAALPPADPVELWAFDQEVVPLGKETAAAWARRVEKVLAERGALGGTDLGALLERLAAAGHGARAVLVTDGEATMGKSARADLVALSTKLPAGLPLHALVLGARQDAETLATLTQGRGRVVAVPFSESMREAAVRAAGRLRLPPGAELAVSDPSAEWSFPAAFHDVQPGAELIVLGKLKPGAAPSARLGSAAPAAAAVPRALPATSFAPLLEREAYRAYLAYLAEREAAETMPAVREALATEQVKVSQERRILVPRTTLLVLESEADYRRFGLDRRALAAILTVGATGVERIDRAGTEAWVPPTPVPIVQPPPRPRNGRVQPLSKGTATDGAGRKDAAKTTTADRSRREETAGSDLSAAAASGVERQAEGGVEGGVAGGVLGPVRGGRLGGVSPTDAVTESDSRPAPSVAPPPPPAQAVPGSRPETYAAVPPPPEPPRPAGSMEPAPVAAPRPEAPARSAPSTAVRPVSTPSPQGVRPVPAPDWTESTVPSREEVARLEAQVREQPLRREPWTRLSEALAARREWKELRDLAFRWQPYDPENPQVYETLGAAALALGRRAEAIRAWGSLVEVAGGKPELLQRAGLLLWKAGAGEAAEAPLRRAVELRPDRVNAHRHLALVLWQQGRHAEAARVLEEAAGRAFPAWYGNTHRVVLEELAYVYRSWATKEPSRRAEIGRKAAGLGVDLDRTDGLRFTLAWETDANDVDLHVVDPRGEECFYSHRTTATGLTLYEDVTRGFGPEVVRTDAVAAGTYSAGVNYFSSGPMGVSRGVLVVVRASPRGGDPSVEVLPFRLVPGDRAMRLLAKVGDGR